MTHGTHTPVPFAYGIFLVFFLVFSVYATPLTQAAGAPSIVSYQGRLTDTGGNALGGTGTTYYFKFSLWDSATVGGGTKVWPTATPGVTTLTVKQGYFNADIGDTTNGYPDTLNYNFNNNTKVYLQIEVSSDNATYETLSPRSLITSTAFSQVAGQVSGVNQSSFGTTTAFANSVLTAQSTSTTATALSLIGYSGQTANIFNIINSAAASLFTVAANGNVGVGTSTPAQQISITGNFQLPISTAATGIIYAGSDTLMHSFGTNNFFAGSQAGNLTMTGHENTVLGVNAGSSLTSGYDNILLGYKSGTNLTSGMRNVIIGSNEAGKGITTGSGNILVGGFSANSGTFPSSISNSVYILPSVEGDVSDAQNQSFIIGGVYSSSLTDMYFGSGRTSSSLYRSAYGRINATGGKGANDVGADLILAGGKSTGNAIGGSLIFQTSNTGTSGSTLQSLTEKVRITAGGNMGIGTTSPSNKLEVNGSGYFAGNLTATGTVSFASNLASFNSSGYLTLPSITGTYNGNSYLLVGPELTINNGGNNSGVLRLGFGGTGSGIVVGATSPLAITTSVANFTGTISVASTTGTSSFVNSATFGGRVGIGTTSPSASLSVVGTSTLSNVVFNADNTYDIGANQATRPRTLYLGTSAVIGSAYPPIYTLEVGGSIRIPQGSGMYFRRDGANNGDGASVSSDNTNLTIDASTAPNSRIYLRTGNVNRWFVDATNAYFGPVADNTYDIGTTSARVRTLSVGGNGYFGGVGIGTTSPSAKLAITGTAGTGDIFAIASSTDARLLTVTSAGNLVLGQSSSAGFSMYPYYNGNNNVVFANGNASALTNVRAAGFLVQGSTNGDGTSYSALSTNGVELAPAYGVLWSGTSGQAYNTKDTGLSRISAGVVGVGNGTLGNAAGTLSAGILQSSKYYLGTDLGLFPVGGGQSTVQTYWGLKLVGNSQSTPQGYTPSNTGNVDDFSVMIPNQQASKIGLVVRGASSQTGNLFQWQNSGGTPLGGIDASGNLGIGTTSPSVKTEIYSDSSSNQDILRLNNPSNSGAGTKFSFWANGGETGSLVNTFDGTKWLFSLGVYSKPNLLNLTSTGNVGIGTTSPTNKLEVAGNTYLGGNLTATGTISLSGGGNMIALSGTNAGIDFNGSVLRYGTTGFVLPSTIGSLGGITIKSDLNNNTANITLSPNGSGNTIIGNGNLGIGTTTPGSLLTVGNSNYFGVDSNANTTLGGTGSKTLLVSGTNSGSLQTMNLQGDFSRSIVINNQSSNGGVVLTGGTANQHASIYTNSSFGSINPGHGSIEFGTNGVFRMGITGDNGYVGVGTTTPAAKLAVAGNTYLGGTLIATGTVQLTNYGAGTLTTDANGNLSVSSDERLKDIKGYFTTGLDAIESLKPISFNWKPETGLDTVNTYTGFSAQNVQTAIPEAVSQDKHGNLTLQDRPILATLVNAVKEIGSMIVQIKDGIAYLKNIAVESLTIGSSAKPTGVTFYDEVNGMPYCLKVRGGQSVTVSGVCGSETSVAPSTYSAPVVPVISSTNTTNIIATSTTETVVSTESTSTPVVSATTTEPIATTTVATADTVMSTSTTELIVPPVDVVTPPIETPPSVTPDTTSDTTTTVPEIAPASTTE
ncbi:MAG: tail fiber domain-containing protein [Candidatus Pacebacteria bacterium]|nr:tail fiber domain-containing protein [Candidatus Paceibacterota bacterium]